MAAIAAMHTTKRQTRLTTTNTTGGEGKALTAVSTVVGCLPAKPWSSNPASGLRQGLRAANAADWNDLLIIHGAGHARRKFRLLIGLRQPAELNIVDIH